jgi:hypothetical protein
MRFIIQSIIILTLLSCKNKPSSKESNIIAVDTTTQSIPPKKVDPCVACIDKLKAFPNDSITFERLYGYPNGTRQDQAYDDIELIFKCVNNCINNENVINLIKLSSVIKYDADGPSYLQNNLHEYIKNNKEIIEGLYDGIDCSTFKAHLMFLFEGLENSQYIAELEDVFNSLDVKDKCKSGAIKEIPSKMSHDH